MATIQLCQALTDSSAHGRPSSEPSEASMMHRMSHSLIVAVVSVVACVGGPSSVDSVRASRACKRLGELRDLPFKREPVNDPVYNELIAVGRPAIPCLVDKIDDAT